MSNVDTAPCTPNYGVGSPAVKMARALEAPGKRSGHHLSKYPKTICLVMVLAQPFARTGVYEDSE
jgi:hypothetical protein